MSSWAKNTLSSTPGAANYGGGMGGGALLSGPVSPRTGGVQAKGLKEPCEEHNGAVCKEEGGGVGQAGQKCFKWKVTEDDPESL